MPVKVQRRTRAGTFLDFEAILDAVVTETKAEIDAEIDANLAGRMIHKQSDDRWYVGEIVPGPRSRELQYTVDPDGLGVPAILHEGVPEPWRIEPHRPPMALHWTDDEGEHFADSVIHPAMPPRPFVAEPVRRIAAKIPRRVRARIQAQFRKGR